MFGYLPGDLWESFGRPRGRPRRAMTSWKETHETDQVGDAEKETHKLVWDQVGHGRTDCSVGLHCDHVVHIYIYISIVPLVLDKEDQGRKTYSRLAWSHLFNSSFNSSHT